MIKFMIYLQKAVQFIFGIIALCIGVIGIASLDLFPFLAGVCVLLLGTLMLCELTQ